MSTKKEPPWPYRAKGYFFPATQAKQPKKFVFHKMKWENGKMVKETEPKPMKSSNKLHLGGNYITLIFLTDFYPVLTPFMPKQPKFQ